MVETATIVLGALVIAWLGRGAHDLRLRERAQQRRADDLDALERRQVELAKRQDEVDARLATLEGDIQNTRNALALATPTRRR